MANANKNKISNCDKCEFLRMYDYGCRIYYCDHEDRTDDMGKLSVDYLPETSPEWCPKREKERRSNAV